MRRVLERVSLGLISVAAPADLLEILIAPLEDDVLANERPIDPVACDELVENAVGERQIGAGPELDVEDR